MRSITFTDSPATALAASAYPSGYGRRLAAALLAGLCLSGQAAAQLPDGACYLYECDDACAAQDGANGVGALSLRFNRLTPWERENKVTSRHVQIAALMAERGQGLRDGVAGKRLTQTAFCRAETMSCWTGGNAASFTLEMGTEGRLFIETTHFPLADFGESDLESDLTPHRGQSVRFALLLAAVGTCPLE